MIEQWSIWVSKSTVDTDQNEVYFDAMIIQPTDKVPPPVRREPMGHIIASVRALEPGQSILVPNGNNNSIKAIVSRLRRKLKKKQTFATAKEKKGVRIWRLT